ncbi:MAG: hypothetical protein KDC59_13575 [Saprospiraceae bacterium]|nr:hypothetical protein [Saprospiraceae bacterium]HPG07736.1 hypothetical protein [Saprospiraceae bacterium]HQU52831.1 hypothetical protein [Saprospiraceae bacterium]
MQRTICLLMFAFTLACSKDEIALGKGDSFVFGVYHGFCANECVTLFKLENDKLYLDEMNRLDPENLVFSSSPLPDSSFQKAMKIWELFPEQLLSEPEQIGIPDAHDQGGYYLRLSQGGSIHSWYIDTVLERLPEYLQQYLIKLNEVKLL